MNPYDIKAKFFRETKIKNPNNRIRYKLSLTLILKMSHKKIKNAKVITSLAKGVEAKM